MMFTYIAAAVCSLRA